MHKKKLYIVKIGGNVINNEAALKHFVTEFSSVKGLKLLVHGGGRLLDVLAQKLGIPQQMVDGRRITDADTLNLASMVYAGSINKNIVALLQSAGSNAIGLSGADMNCIKAEKRIHPTHDFGYVGDIKAGGVNAAMISLLLENGLVPVFCSITHDGKGQLLNTNADTLSSAIAIALADIYDVQLHYCFEKKGVLRQAEDDSSLIDEISAEHYQTLLQEKVVTAGMIPKLDNAFAAIGKGVSTVVIGHANELLNAIDKKEHAGTYLVA
jgi:acetylglutamate kinase